MTYFLFNSFNDSEISNFSNNSQLQKDNIEFMNPNTVSDGVRQRETHLYVQFHLDSCNNNNVKYVNPGCERVCEPLAIYFQNTNTCFTRRYLTALGIKTQPFKATVCISNICGGKSS